METISIYELKRMDLRDATVIDGFPSVGLVSSIVANYLINAMELEQIGILDSLHFPAVALVRNAEPLNTVRVYAKERADSGPGANGGDQVVVFISEFQPPSSLVKGIARTMLDWIQEQRCRQLICPEGLTLERREGGGGPGGGDGEEQEAGHVLNVSESVSGASIPITHNGNGASPGAGEAGSSQVFGIASTPTARRLLEKGEIPLFQDGVITGLAGVLLNEGKIRDFPVLGLFCVARPDFPDARAAAKVIEAINRVVLHIKLDPKPLYREAESIESRLRSIHEKAKVAPREVPPPPHMYG